MRIDADIKLGFKDVLIRPKRSTLFSRSEVSLERTYQYKYSKQTMTGIPIIASNMDTIGTFEMAASLSSFGIQTTVHKHYSIEQWRKAMDTMSHSETAQLSVSSGITNADLEKLHQILELTGIKSICVDVANGYSEKFVLSVKRLREEYPEVTIMAGNIVTGEMTEELILSGADVVKVGIGPGSVCTTRRVTGVGYPQLSAVIECADAAHGLGGLIISDGGCTCAGDVAKAFGGGADFVMLGGMLAGHDESGGDIIEVNGQKMKRFYGMSSSVAMDKYSGGVADYRTSEGKQVLVPYRGPVSNTILEVLGGLRSACTYVGAHCIKELSKRTTFVRVTEQTNDVFTTPVLAPEY